MTSVDRIDRYSELEIEDYSDETGDVPDTNWPSTGQVQFVSDPELA